MLFVPPSMSSMVPDAFAETRTVIIVEPGGNCILGTNSLHQEPSNVCFSPGILRIQVGDTVTWINESSEGRKVVSENPDHNFESHWITGYNDRANFEEEWSGFTDPPDFDSYVERTTSFSYTFNQNDIVLYYYGYPTEREIRISDYKFTGAILVGCPPGSEDLRNIIGGEWINLATLEGYQGNKDYDLGWFGNECQKSGIVSQLADDSVSDTASVAAIGLLVVIGIPVIIIVVVILIKRRKKTPKLVKQKPKKKIQNKGTAPFCSQCGTQYRTDAKFCGKCGNQV